LVLGLIDPSFQTLAGPPSFETCTRDVYPCDWKVGSKTLLELVRGLAAAGAQLHERGILHGDFYAHNVLWHESGQVYLGDLGAASFYEREGPQAGALERLEVRAFGVLLAELLAHTTFAEEDTAWAVRLGGLSAECLQAEVAKRPPFVEIVQRVA
jgi:serine/threonine protein kinase